MRQKYQMICHFNLKLGEGKTFPFYFFINQNVIVMSKTKSERWYEILLEECYKEMNLDQINRAKERVLAIASESQAEKIRENYHINMQNGRLKQKLEEYQGKSLASQLDLFFGVNKKPTYDVGTLPPESGGLDNNIDLTKLND